MTQRGSIYSLGGTGDKGMQALGLNKLKMTPTLHTHLHHEEWTISWQHVEEAMATATADSSTMGQRGTLDYSIGPPKEHRSGGLHIHRKAALHFELLWLHGFVSTGVGTPSFRWRDSPIYSWKLQLRRPLTVQNSSEMVDYMPRTNPITHLLILAEMKTTYRIMTTYHETTHNTMHKTYSWWL